KFDNDRENSFRLSATTDTQGYVALDFNLPRDLIAEGGTLEITGARGEFAQKAEVELQEDYQRLGRIILTTDKPIYQPGQPLHLRALALDFSNRAIANAELELKIVDPEGTTQFRGDLKTSRFGVANIDWQIPGNTRLGDYRLEIEMDDDERGEATVQNRVTITRYDLPNFAVKAKADRDYYLPGQNAIVEVRGEYLFGQPVARGKVRIVREKERQWNYREQKWDVQEEATYEGEVDAAGRFVARIDLAGTHKTLAGEAYKRFEDLTYAAYFTDATTGRTEQKRFDLRVTREPIHIYVLGLDDHQSNALPMQFYVSTSYADGAPAQCEVSIRQRIRIAGSPKPEERADEALRRVRTNRFGVAKVSGVEVRQDGTSDRELRLTFSARDGSDRIGNLFETVWLGDQTQARIETDKAIYRAGEPIEVQLTSSSVNAALVLNVTREFVVLHSQIVQLRNGKALALLPYRPEFSDELTVSIAGDDDDNGSCCSSHPNASRKVIYPRDTELKLDVRLNAGQYRPGEEARATFSVLTPDGHPVETALGVSVVDRAVQERARTDSEFSRQRYYGFASQFYGRNESVAGMTLRDLRKLDLTEHVREDVQLVAEMLLRDGGYAPQVASGDQYLHNQQRVFSDSSTRQFAQLGDALKEHLGEDGAYPKDRASLDRILKKANLNFESLRDPWDVPYRTAFSTEQDRDRFSAMSAGADKKFDTADDFAAFNHTWPYLTKISERIQRIEKLYSGDNGRMTLDTSVFKDYLKQNGVDFDALRDRWGNPYAIGLQVNGAVWLATIRSSGPNGKFETDTDHVRDDFSVRTAFIDYFEGMKARIDVVLTRHFQTTGTFPENDSALSAVLHANGIELDRFRDQWGRALHATFLNRHNDRVVVHYSDLKNGSMAALKRSADSINYIVLRSRGEDGKENTLDDSVFAQFSRFAVEGSHIEQGLKATRGNAVIPGGTGAIKGTIVDSMGSAVSGVFIIVTSRTTQNQRETRSDADGGFLIANLPSDGYTLHCAAPGFRSVIIEGISVRSATMTEVSVTVEVGTVSETVTVSASVQTVQTESSSVSMSSRQLAELPLASLGLRVAAIKPGAHIATESEPSTPRLREHFQETLVWQPQLETDA
ncbi:MAG: MG2 domain-containing protein, partial [Acidobacteriota bacterium]